MRTTQLLALAVFVPVVAFATGWEARPTNWLPQEIGWALPLAPAGMTATELVEDYASPPRAAWCGPEGLWRQPVGQECDLYDQALDTWVDDLNLNAPAYNYPPTYCGGC
jgi:hypothetical protein